MQRFSNESLFLVEFSEDILSPKHWCFWDFILDSLPPTKRTFPNFIRQGCHVSMAKSKVDHWGFIGFMMFDVVFKLFHVVSVV